MIIEHFNISAPAQLLAQEKAFFCELFNLKEGFRPKFRRPGFWLYHGEQALLHLTQSDEHQPSNGQGCLDHIAFQMTGLGDLIAKLESAGIEYQTDSLPEIGMTQVFFSSPSGVGLEANFIRETLAGIKP